MLKNLSNVQYVFRLLKDPEVPKWNKGVLIFALVYFFLPIDFIPEAVFPGLGHIDDLLLLLGVFNSLSDIFQGYRQEKQEKNGKKTGKEKVLGEDRFQYTVKDENNDEK